MKDKIKYTMQNSMHSLLNLYYTGSGLSFRNKILYPYFCYNDPNIKKKLGAINGMVRSEDTEKKQNILNKISLEKKKLSSKEIATFLSSYFTHLNGERISNEKKAIISIPSIDLFAYPNEDKEYISVLKRLHEIGKNLHTEKKGILLLFGSLATRDYVKGHSDLDTVFIISKEACQSPKMLLEIRKDIAEIMRESYFIDSLQHHGPYIFTEHDLDMFPQYYLPFAVWERMVSFCGNVQLKFIERETREEEIMDELERYKEMFLKIVETPLGKLPKSNYSRKYLYQAILLFPAVYFLARGKPCYKRDSFVLIRKHLSDKGNGLLDALSNVWSTNGFRTRAASSNIQAFFRMIPYPFCYPFIYRLFFSNTLREGQKQKIKSFMIEGVKEYIKLIDIELKKYENKKNR